MSRKYLMMHMSKYTRSGSVSSKSQGRVILTGIVARMEKTLFQIRAWCPHELRVTATMVSHDSNGATCKSNDCDIRFFSFLFFIFAKNIGDHTKGKDFHQYPCRWIWIGIGLLEMCYKFFLWVVQFLFYQTYGFVEFGGIGEIPRIGHPESITCHLATMIHDCTSHCHFYLLDGTSSMPWPIRSNRSMTVQEWECLSAIRRDCCRSWRRVRNTSYNKLQNWKLKRLKKLPRHYVAREFFL